MIPKQWMLGTDEHHEGGDHWRKQKNRRGGKGGEEVEGYQRSETFIEENEEGENKGSKEKRSGCRNSYVA